MSKLLLQFSTLPAKLDKAEARLAIEEVVDQLMAQKTSSVPNMMLAVAHHGKTPEFVINFAYQRDPVMGARVTNIKVRYAKKGETLTAKKYPKLKLVELPAPKAEEKPEKATQPQTAAPAEPKDNQQA